MLAKATLFVLFAGVVVASGMVHAAALNMKEGLWEVTAVAEGRKTPPSSARHCISHKDVENPQKMIPGGEGTGCEIKDHKVQDNVVSWNMVCTGKTPMSGSGSITFGETSYTGRSTLSVNRGDKPVQMTVRYNGKYLGPCKK